MPRLRTLFRLLGLLGHDLKPHLVLAHVGQFLPLCGAFVHLRLAVGGLGIHRHLLLVCLAVIVSWVLPGPWVRLISLGFLYLTILLRLRLGPFQRNRRLS